MTVPSSSSHKEKAPLDVNISSRDLSLYPLNAIIKKAELVLAPGSSYKVEENCRWMLDGPFIRMYPCLFFSSKNSLWAWRNFISHPPVSVAPNKPELALQANGWIPRSVAQPCVTQVDSCTCTERFGLNCLWKCGLYKHSRQKTIAEVLYCCSTRWLHKAEDQLMRNHKFLGRVLRIEMLKSSYKPLEVCRISNNTNKSGHTVPAKYLWNVAKYIWNVTLFARTD